MSGFFKSFLTPTLSYHILRFLPHYVFGINFGTTYPSNLNIGRHLWTLLCKILQGACINDVRFFSSFLQLNEYETNSYFLWLSHHLTSYYYWIYEDLHRFAQICSQNCFCYCFWTILGTLQLQKQFCEHICANLCKFS